MKDVYHYLPKTKREFNWFIILSISAGICEEIIFRLFLFEYLNENIGLLIAFVLTNIIFALTHIGMGKQNIISSFILGLLFSAIYYFTDNIWIAILLHIAIDINGGILGYRINNFEQKKT
ncbi:MAG TPA: CPBP family intramembrane metalloprotease [Fulvivirga sp.]|nr:CPBP family intramembrane metalloprotease [Fulvivirga sp.]